MSRSACGFGKSKNNPTWRMPAITVSRPTCSLASNSGESIRRMPLICCHIDRAFLSRSMLVSQSITPYSPPCPGCGVWSSVRFPACQHGVSYACAPDLRAYAVQCSNRGAGTWLYCPVVPLFSTLWEVRRSLRISEAIAYQGC